MASDFNKTVDQFSQIDSYSHSWGGSFYVKEEEIQTARCWQFCRKISLCWKKYKKLSKEEEIAQKIADFIRGDFTRHFGQDRNKIIEAQNMVQRLIKKLNTPTPLFCLTRYLETLQNEVDSLDRASTIVSDSSSSLGSPRVIFEPPLSSVAPRAFPNRNRVVPKEREGDERAQRIERNMLSWSIMQPTLTREFQVPYDLIHPNFDLEDFERNVREKAEGFVKLREGNRANIVAQYHGLLTELGLPLSEPVSIPDQLLYFHYIDASALKRWVSEQISKQILFYIPSLSRKFTEESLSDALRAHEGIQIRPFIEKEVRECILEDFRTFKMGHGGYSPERDIPLFDSLYQYGRPFVYQGKDFGGLPRNVEEFRVEVDPDAWANIVVAQ